MANIVISDETWWAFVGQLINKFCPIMPRYLNRQNMADDMIEALNRIIQEYNRCSNKEDFELWESDCPEIWAGILIGVGEPHVNDFEIEIMSCIATFLSKHGMVIDG